MEKQSKTKLLKVLRTLQGYQRMCLGKNVSFDLESKNIGNSITIIVWIIKDSDFRCINIYDFFDDEEVARRLQCATAILKEYGIIKD